MITRSLGWLVLAMAAACAEPMSPGWRIEDPRVLGARVQVVGEETRATPLPEEHVNVSFLLASPPDQEEPVGWAFLSCIKQANTAGLPLCKGRPSFADLVMGTGAPSFTVTMPSLETLGADRTVMLLGVVCFGGTPTVDAATQRPGCSEGTVKTQATTLDLTLAVEPGTRNRNVSMEQVAITLDERRWIAPRDNVPAIGCDGANSERLPIVEADGKEHTVRADLSGVTRDEFTRTVAGNPPVTSTQNETLQLSHFTTRGDLGRQFSVVDDRDNTDTTVSVGWTTPSAELASARGTRVDFVFVLRDGRGGTDWRTRSVCLVGSAE